VSETLRLEIVTPSGVAFKDDVEMVTLPAVDGAIGVRPRHLPILTRIAPGEAVALSRGSEQALAVGEGLAVITGDRVSIVTDMAIAAKDIDEAQIQAARERALARLHDKISDEEIATVNASLARALAQLRVKQRRAR